MALFRRTNSEPTEPPARASVASAGEAAQLRGRARRRLVGAIALVLAAVIVLPMALDSEPIPLANDIAIVIPERASAYQPQFAGDAAQVAPSSPPQTTPQSTPQTTLQQPEPSTAHASASNPASSTDTRRSTTTAPVSAAKQTPAPPARTSSATPSTPIPQPATPARTDDGSHAIALLEGRADPRAADTGNTYVLQIAAYSNQNDAQTRRDQLLKAGVANAFVEAATVNGKPQYRLRVGPFANRADAQAAQPRLRTLGYDNGFIASQ